MSATSSAALREQLPDDAIFANGAGNFATWLHRFFRYTRLPHAARADLAARWATASRRRSRRRCVHPERTVVCFAGDGDFLMTGQELATAVQYGLPIVVLVVNNGMYGTIRMHQERDYPGRVFGTDLSNPDFAAYARAFGAHGEIVERTEDVRGRARRARWPPGSPALIELRIDPQAITPRTTLDAIRDAAAR